MHPHAQAFVRRLARAPRSVLLLLWIYCIYSAAALLVSPLLILGNEFVLSTEGRPMLREAMNQSAAFLGIGVWFTLLLAWKPGLLTWACGALLGVSVALYLWFGPGSRATAVDIVFETAIPTLLLVMLFVASIRALPAPHRSS